MTAPGLVLYPAIDILAGRAVRLVKGDFDAKKVYAEDPLQAAAAWVAEGAEWLHVVDLDGARAGEPRNLAHLRRIASQTAVPVQYGGGLRTPQAIEQALQAGAARVVLGTAALADPGFLQDALARWPARVLVSVDARGGRVATAGWTQTSGSAAAETIAELVERGAHDLVYTDVDRDGMLEGPHIDALATLAQAAAGARLIYSGGIGSLEHLRALAGMSQAPIAGVIVGKALYEQRFTVAQARRALAGDSDR